MAEKIYNYFRGALRLLAPDKKKGLNWRFSVLGKVLEVDALLARMQRDIGKTLSTSLTDPKESMALLQEVVEYQSSPEKMAKLEDDLEQFLMDRQRTENGPEEKTEITATEFDMKLEYYKGVLRPFDRRKEVDEFLVHSESLKVFRDVSIPAWAGRMGLNLKTLKAKNADPVYLPKHPPGILPPAVEGGAERINSYQRPNYFLKVDSVDKKSPIFKKTISLFERYIEHLFPWEVEREYFKDWVYQSLFDRSKTYLVLCGRPGIGKTVLSSVLKGLHGESNAVDGKASTLTERFNGQLSESTLIWFDEIRYSRDSSALENLKQNQNDTVSVESKGVDANRGQQIFASMVLSNNYVSHNAFSYDDRKFAPLVLTEKRLEDVFTQIEISFLSSGFFEGSAEYSPEAVASLYAYFRDRGFVGKHGKKKWNSKTMEFYSPMFYSMCYWNMSNWAKACLDWVMENVPSGKYATFGTIPKDKNIDKDPKYVEGLDKELRKVLGKQRVPREVVVRDGLSHIKDMEGAAIFMIEILCKETGALKIGLTKKSDKFKLSDTYLRPEGTTEDSDEEVKF